MTQSEKFLRHHAKTRLEGRLINGDTSDKFRLANKKYVSHGGHISLSEEQIPPLCMGITEMCTTSTDCSKNKLCLECVILYNLRQHNIRNNIKEANVFTLWRTKIEREEQCVTLFETHTTLAYNAGFVYTVTLVGMYIHEYDEGFVLLSPGTPTVTSSVHEQNNENM